MIMRIFAFYRKAAIMMSPHNWLDLPDEYYLMQNAAQQMESYVAALGSGAIDSTALRQSIRHLIDYGQDSELCALFEYAIIQAFTNVTYPTDKQQLRRNVGKASTRLEMQYLVPKAGQRPLTKTQITKIVALFEQLALTTNLAVQNLIIEEIEREHASRQTQRMRSIERVLGPKASSIS